MQFCMNRVCRLDLKDGGFGVDREVAPAAASRTRGDTWGHLRDRVLAHTAYLTGVRILGLCLLDSGFSYCCGHSAGE
jgi:hypothetical protein